MSDTPPVSFMPATRNPAATAPDVAPQQNGHDHHEHAPAAPVNERPTIQRAPTSAPSRQPEPVKLAYEDLPVDPELGKKYRPFELGGVTFRCAAKIPANAMLSIVAKQSQLADAEVEDISPERQREMLFLIGEMLSAVLWPMERDRMEARLTDPIDPVDLPELVQAVQALWADYNVATGTGKEQQGS